jgi:hypothetical protein
MKDWFWKILIYIFALGFVLFGGLHAISEYMRLTCGSRFSNEAIKKGDVYQ